MRINSRYIISVLGLSISLLALISCNSTRTTQNSGKLNVVLIVVDTLPAKQLGIYNSTLDNSPTIDGLAKDGATFTMARSVSSWTKPSIASLFTSKPPSEHFVNSIKDKLPEREDTLAELFKAKGYKTAGFVSHTIIGPRSGYQQGFDEYKQLNTHKNTHAAITSPEVIDNGNQWLNSVNDDRFFLFLHLFDPHFRYLDHEGYTQADDYKGDLKPKMSLNALMRRKGDFTPEDIEYLKDLQREEVAFTDHHISRLIEHLKSLGKYQDTIIVITADHGEEFMEHTSLGHTETLFDELLHIPLIFHAPGRVRALVDNTPVNLLDVAPTVFELATGETIKKARGASLAKSILAGEKAGLERDLFAEVAYRQVSQGDRLQPNLIAVMSPDGYKLIHDRGRSRWMLYNLNNDPEEKVNLATVEVDRVIELKKKLAKLEALHDAGLKPVEEDRDIANEEPSESNLSPDGLKNLKSLG